MHDDTVRIVPVRNRPGPPPSVYIILRIIGCRIHYRSAADGWTPRLSVYSLHFLSAERELAYSTAQACHGLLVKMTLDEWNAAMDAWRKEEEQRAADDERRHA
jgi:hypothetical protein